MSSPIEAAQISGEQPAIDDGLRGQFRIIEVVGHDRLAARRHFTDAFGIWIENAQFHAGKRLAHRIRAEGFEVIQGERGASFGQTVSVRHRNSQAVKELEG